jgi:hypothetical protein
MKEFYAEECGQDYGVLCWQEQIRQSVTKELLEEILNIKINKFEIDFENEIIDYLYYNTAHSYNLWDDISINEFIKKSYESSRND